MVRVLNKEVHRVKVNNSKEFYLPVSTKMLKKLEKNIIRFLEQFWMFLLRYQIYSELGSKCFLSYHVTE